MRDLVKSFQLEKEIQTIRAKPNIPYMEAKKIVDSRIPTVGLTYVAAATKNSQQNKKQLKTIATQTDDIPHTTKTPQSRVENKSNRNLSTISATTQKSKPPFCFQTSAFQSSRTESYHKTVKRKSSQPCTFR